MTTAGVPNWRAISCFKASSGMGAPPPRSAETATIAGLPVEATAVLPSGLQCAGPGLLVGLDREPQRGYEPSQHRQDRFAVTTSQDPTPAPRFAAGFEPASEQRWLDLVAKILEGADFERRLVSRTADGLRIKPLYTRADALAGAETAVPGAAPFTRGSSTERPRPGWDIRTIHVETDPKAANAAILEDLAGGATSICLQIAAPGGIGLPCTGADLAAALEGVDLELCPVALVAGEYTADAAGSLMALWRARGIEDGKCRGAFGADPLGTLARTGALYHPAERSIDIAAGLAAGTRAMPGVTALMADGHPYHAAGASEAQELAAMLSTLVAYLRGAERAGLAPADALPRIAIGLAADADQLLTIAKLRAGRRLVWQVASACGAGDAAGRVQLASATAWRMLARRDPWVNMLRAAVGCAAAGMGGADAIVVLPFTWPIGKPDAFARRIARNTQIVLLEESGLGRVADPAGGSWYVERLTDDLARKAWAIFQEWEGAGGMAAALGSGLVQDQIAATAEARAGDIATGRIELTGSSAFPRLGGDGVTVEPWPGPPLSADLNGEKVARLRMARLAEPFERLRDRADAHAARTGTPPRIFLANLGTLNDFGARATWVRNFLAAGGIEAVGDGGFTSSAEAGKAFAESGAWIACLCSSDAVYGELGEATASLLKNAGARRVLLAGRPKGREAALRMAGVDELLVAGCDAVETLGALQAALGVAD
jgi:methylmalonyl-CoA mutase